MNKYMENMTILVSSFKESFKKDETSAVGAAPIRVTKLNKPAKGPPMEKRLIPRDVH